MLASSTEQSLPVSSQAMVPPTQVASLRAVLNQLQPHWNAKWAWDNYRTTILALSQGLGLHHLCEIGGGRDPLFSPDEVKQLGLELTINDISPVELANAPAGLHTACFDIAGDIAAAGMKGNQFDLMFSRMVFEHVHNVEQAWKNIHTLLTPGGVALAFFPTLYSLPFVLNKLMPEQLSRAILKVFYPARRDDGDDPKFPALYDHCFGDDESQNAMLSPIGFREVLVVPFWGHEYFARMPGIREVDGAFNAFAAKQDWRKATSHAYVLVRK